MRVNDSLLHLAEGCQIWGVAQAPKKRYALGIFPTPIHPWHPPGLPDGIQMYIKRDDLSGMQLSGNKVTSDSVLASFQACKRLYCIHLP